MKTTLAERLLAHAALHDAATPHDEEQAAFASDLRKAADIMAALAGDAVATRANVAGTESDRDDIDTIALEVARRFTLDTEPQRRAALQVAIIDAIKRAAPSPPADAATPLAARQDGDARSANDYAIEYAGYLATAARHLLDARNQHDALVLRQAESDDVFLDEIEDAESSLQGATDGLRSAIYEFEKRRDRALTAKDAAPGPGVGQAVRVSPNFGELINALHRASVGGHLHESIDRHYADFWFSPIRPAPADSAPPAVEGVRRFIAERAVQPEFRQDVMDGDYDGTSWFQAVAAALAAPAPDAGQFADEEALVTFLGTLCEDGGQGGEWEVAQAAIAGIRAWQANVHADDIAVDHFAAAMKEKLAAARAKGRSGWEDKAQCTAETLSRMLVDHVAKGDPRDVANFCMMLWNRGEGIAPAAGVGEAVARLDARDLFDPARLPDRDAEGYLSHPDLARVLFVEDETDVTPFFHAAGLELLAAHYEWPDHGDEDDGISLNWLTPDVPAGDGWRLAHIGDTEDGSAVVWWCRFVGQKAAMRGEAGA